ncbi:glycosyltransferase family 4 protein [Halosimplex halophilum]|uniref:glycosyltransferase family 4 protein n=1 Tax=Halosimplex halophilum TaxID=2559572 RepID=UPI00107F43B9|nr:glycosyltransferase family 4 protein [Halosimplex halophilum]
MRVCFLSPKAYPQFDDSVEGTPGGAEVQMVHLGRRLAQRESVDVHFVVADYGQPSTVVQDGVTIHRSYSFDDPLWMKIAKFGRKHVRADADVYIQRTLSPFSAPLAALTRLRGRRYVYMVSHDHEADGTHDLFCSPFTRPLAKGVYELSNLVITQNRYQERMVEEKFDLHNTRLLRSGVKLKNTEPAKELKYDAIWVGRCIERKQPDVMLDIVEQNPDWDAVMIAPQATGERSYFEKIRSRAEAINNIEFVSLVPNDRVIEYLEQSAVFCLTSRHEGYPMVLIEAAAARTPIVSLSLNYPLPFNDYHAGIHCGGEIDTFITEVQRLLSEKSKLNEYADNARRYAENEHDIEKKADEFYRMIDPN